MKLENVEMGATDAEDVVKPKPRILVVEDAANVAELLVARLELFGYDVCDVAGSGPDAVASALNNRPDLILMDILLEGDMNGIEAAALIGAELDVPVIYLSCLNDREVLDKALKTQPYGFILKPYDKDELRFSIENALDRFRENQEREKRIAYLEAKAGDKGE